MTEVQNHRMRNNLALSILVEVIDNDIGEKKFYPTLVEAGKGLGVFKLSIHSYLHSNMTMPFKGRYKYVKLANSVLDYAG